MSKLEDLLNKKITRKQFMAGIPSGVLALYGLSSVIRVLHHTEIQAQQPGDYSYGDYGDADAKPTAEDLKPKE